MRVRLCLYILKNNQPPYYILVRSAIKTSTGENVFVDLNVVFIMLENKLVIVHAIRMRYAGGG